MNSESLNLWLFLLTIARFLAMTMLGPAIVIAIVYEQVSGRAVSRHQSVEYQQVQSGNKPARNVLARVA